jgi:hypothetical protein
VHHCNDFAGSHFGALTTGFESFRFYTEPYFTGRTMAKQDFILAASEAVDAFNSDAWGIKLFLPVFGSFCPHFVIIVQRRNPGVAGSAVKAAARDKFFHSKLVFNYLNLFMPDSFKMMNEALTKV